MNLINKGSYWMVAFVQDSKNKIERFPTIDSACDYMVDVLGTDDDEVDLAVIHLNTKNHRIALFLEGKFDHTLPE